MDDLTGLWEAPLESRRQLSDASPVAATKRVRAGVPVWETGPYLHFLGRGGGI